MPFPAVPVAGIQPRTEGGTNPQISAAAGRPYRLWVILKHLPGLLLAAVLLHALPLQVPLLGLLEDLVRPPLPLPQELGGLRGAQQHGWAAPGRRERPQQDEQEERREQGEGQAAVNS